MQEDGKYLIPDGIAECDPLVANVLTLSEFTEINYLAERFLRWRHSIHSVVKPIHT